MPQPPGQTGSGSSGSGGGRGAVDITTSSSPDHTDGGDPSKITVDTPFGPVTTSIPKPKVPSAKDLGKAVAPTFDPNDPTTWPEGDPTNPLTPRNLESQFGVPAPDGGLFGKNLEGLGQSASNMSQDLKYLNPAFSPQVLSKQFDAINPFGGKEAGFESSGGQQAAAINPFPEDHGNDL